MRPSRTAYPAGHLAVGARPRAERNCPCPFRADTRRPRMKVGAALVVTSIKCSQAEAFSFVVNPRHFAANAAGVRLGWGVTLRCLPSPVGQLAVDLPRILRDRSGSQVGSRRA